MKPYYLLLIPFFIVQTSFAQSTQKTDTTQLPNNRGFKAVEVLPEFPGGIQAFGKYISKNVKYPEVARLIGINGKVRLSFVVERDGRVTNVTPMNCIGAGCEAEAVTVLQNSPQWSPGVQDGKPVRVQYTVPIDFSIPKGSVNMKQLKKSDYGFVFDIKGTRYTIDEAEKILGKEFPSDQIEIADPFYNSDNIEKFKMPNKKEVYLLKIKSE
jgi:protein TonB